MLTGKQKRYLRGVGHNLNAIFQIGKDGVHQSQVEGIDAALEAHELIKIKILESCSETKNEVAIEISMKTKADVVQILGRTILLYRPSEKRNIQITMIKIGIFGGSFDPIHRSHIRVIEEALRQLQLDKLLVIPTANNPWKDSVGATKKQRLEMLEIALHRYRNVEICRYEIDQDSNDKNYTIDTINYLKTIYPKEQLYFIMGMDQASLFHKWKDAKKISDLVSLVVFERIGYQINENLNKYNFIKLELIASNDASSDIRNGKLHALIPDILKYIVNNGIYLETIVKTKMSNKRYLHTLSMAKLAKEIAINNGLNGTKAYIAGMLHDIAKEMPHDQALSLMKKHFPVYIDKPEAIWHQWLSAYLAKTEYLVDDPEILQAIRHHTTASINMSKLDMCIYEADKYDPSRDFDSSKEIALCKKDVIAGFKLCLKDFYDFSMKKNRKIDNCFFEIYNKYVEGDINE